MMLVQKKVTLRRSIGIVLELDAPITVGPAPGAEEEDSPNLDIATNVREIQLFVRRGRAAGVQDLIGRNVQGTGRLNESVTSQHTKVWLDGKILRLK
jgi:hypothetical protein